jgi:uncharacterized protein (DUF1330 family)
MRAWWRALTALLVGIGVGALGLQALHAQAKPPGIYIAEHEVQDAKTYASYSDRAEETVKTFGGRFLVRGGKADSLQGEGPKGRLVVISFDSVEKAQAWYNSPVYQEIKPIRMRAAKSRVLIVEGVPN